MITAKDDSGSLFGRRIADSLQAIIVSLLIWGGWYIQDLSKDVRSLNNTVIKMQADINNLAVSSRQDREDRDKTANLFFSAAQGSDLINRVSRLEKALDAHVSLYSHSGTDKAIFVLDQEIKAIQDRVKELESRVTSKR